MTLESDMLDTCRKMDRISWKTKHFVYKTLIMWLIKLIMCPPYRMWLRPLLPPPTSQVHQTTGQLNQADTLWSWNSRCIPQVFVMLRPCKFRSEKYRTSIVWYWCSGVCGGVGRMCGKCQWSQDLIKSYCNSDIPHVLYTYHWDSNRPTKIANHEIKNENGRFF